ncbi:MAG: peptide chain release factor N(5)-glutamine methyltransferase [Candidatus Omnitrophica bacterium]|nr:peptide chain release factor N(5)-glutamine methyltransferase [Candidatus Omnitrophota bacterium]
MKASVINLINAGDRYLKQSGVITHRLTSERLLEYVLKGSGVFVPARNTAALGIAGLYLERSLVVERARRKRFFSLVRERAKRFPLQYLIREANFMDFPFLVNQSCLIPRPETELLVENVLGEIRRKIPSGEVRIIDLGTGCGNIALSLARYLPFAQVWASDFSRETLSLAEKNAERLGLRMQDRFILSNLFEKVPAMRFECIVSNPPYLSGADMKALEGEVVFEPREALFGGSEGTETIIRIADEARNFLARDGLLALEIGMGQAEKIRPVFKSLGYSHIRMMADYAGVRRIALARYRASRANSYFS